MDEELIQEYLRRFNRAFSLLESSGRSSVWYMELTEDYLRQNQQEYADRMLQDGSTAPDVFSSSALIFYGYRLGAVRLKDKNECYTRQGGYMDNAIWNYNLDEILNEEIDENKDAAASHIIQWITNPGSNIDVAEDILSKMIVPMIRNLCKITPPGKRPECTIVMPPISKEIEIQDWAVLFSDLRVRDLQVKIVNYGHLLRIDDDERVYIVQYQTDGFREYVVISAYEVIRGHNTCIGCMAFDIADYDRQYILQDVKPISITVDNQAERYDKNQTATTVADWQYLDCKYPVIAGINSYLGSHTASFGREIYRLTSDDDDARNDSSTIKAVFHGNEALQAVEVCARCVKEENLYNIALGDLVYVANILERHKCYKPVSIGTKGNYKLGTYIQFAPYVDISKMHQIPANYASISWKMRDTRRSLVPYFTLDAKKHTEKQIVESIIGHYEHCSTATVADDLLYMYRDGEDPSAFFVAKVFMYLLLMDTVEIESRNEIITSIENVDDVEYQEIDKSHIKLTAPTGRLKQKSSIFKQSSAEQKMSAAVSIPIEKMGLTARSYNCLRRAGIKTAGDLSRKTRKDLSKVRNLGSRSADEVVMRLHGLGLRLADE